MTIDFANNALRRGRAECDQRLERVKGIARHIKPKSRAWPSVVMHRSPIATCFFV
jgi:hypothetical protein